MIDSTRLPLDFPPLVEMAASAAAPERLARILSDLTRLASRDAWLRWLGAVYRWPEPGQCPEWRWAPPTKGFLDELGEREGADPNGMWILIRHDPNPLHGVHTYGATRSRRVYSVVPGIDVSGPEAWPVALRQVILFVGEMHFPR